MRTQRSADSPLQNSDFGPAFTHKIISVISVKPRNRRHPEVIAGGIKHQINIKGRGIYDPLNNIKLFIIKKAARAGTLTALDLVITRGLEPPTCGLGK